MIKSAITSTLLLLGLAISSSAMAFSNLIVFGDSLSDNGNFPEAPTPFKHTKAPKRVADTSTSFYVPFSNPVNFKTGNANPPTLRLRILYPWPQLNPSLLAPQVPIEQGNTSMARQYRSLSWTELFLAYAQLKGKTKSPHVVPSYLLMQQKIPLNSSVNYAWGSALGAPGCYDRYYRPFKSCDRQQVMQARQHYMLNPTYENRVKIPVPGLPQQVSFFIDDMNAKRVHVKDDTVYAFWIGGNNLVDAYNHMVKGHLSKLFSFIFGGPTRSTLSAINTMTKALPVNDRPKVVYLFSLMNAGLTPGYYNGNLATLAKVLTFSYNSWSALLIDFHNMHSKTKVKMVPVHSWYHAASHYDYFKATMGKSCQINGGDFSQANKIPDSNCKGFMYWNDVHPAVDMQKITAYSFLQLIT